MAAAQGRPEDKFSSGVYWIWAIAITIVTAVVVNYMNKTVGVNTQPTQNNLTLPMSDHSGQLPASK